MDAGRVLRRDSMFIKVSDTDYVNSDYIVCVENDFFGVHISMIDETGKCVETKYKKDVLNALGIPELSQDECEKARKRSEIRRR